MKHLAAYLLLVLGGKEAPTAADVTAMLKKVDIDADAAQVEALIKGMEGKKLDDVLKEGEAKLITVGGSGGGGGGGGNGGDAAPAKGADAGKKEEKKEKEKPKEEEAIDIGGGDLFGGGGKKGGGY